MNTIKPLRARANRLLRMDTTTIAGVKKFYRGVNGLASEIVSNHILLKKLASINYSDNQKLIKGITHILGYGQVIGRYSDLFSAKEIKLNAFLKKNPLFKSGIVMVQKEAMIYFNKLSKEIKEYIKEEIDKGIKEHIETTNIKKDVELMKKIVLKGNVNTSLIITKNNDDYYINESRGPRRLKLKRTSLYYAAFDAVYSLAPEGGLVAFKDFEGRADVKLKTKLKNKNKDDNWMCKIIRSYLTDPLNGFLRASRIGNTEFKGKPLIECEPHLGITFNNKK